MFEFQIKNSQGEIATVKVDDDMVELVSQSSWFLTAKGYVQGNGGFFLERLHRLVIGAKPGEIVDHINRDKLDNRRENLRIVTPKESNMNQGVRQGKVSGQFKGVFRKGERFYAKHATVKSKNFLLETSAALEYDKMTQAYPESSNQVLFPDVFTDAVVRAYQLEQSSSLSGNSKRSEINAFGEKVFRETGLVIPKAKPGGAKGPQEAKAIGGSGYRGVHVCRTQTCKGFKAVGQLGNRNVYIKFSKSAEVAARAYDAWAVQQFGSAAILNFP
jgi:hypothetical protein